MALLEGIICPECSIPLNEKELADSLVCSYCRTNLKDAKYLNFIEYLVANGIVTDIDFFDTKLYKDEIERLDPTDQEDIDPREYEKKKDLISLFEEDIEIIEFDNTEKMNEWEGLEEDWEEFNRRNMEEAKKNAKK
ncbi:MAG: hypothetical protein IIA61_12010 [Candidatus Marinimicrobia bacterium]|nr:hypothetical protein [Candidatus Neomarinimicrobiota bacterium]